MRIAFSGAGDLTVMTVPSLVAKGHEVVIIDSDRKRIEELSEQLDCSFLHGDASKPAILREVGPQQTDMLICLTDDDKDNIIASLVGRSLGFKRIVTSIQDPDYEDICRELGLEDIIIPARMFSRSLRNMVEGLAEVELSTVLKHEARFFTFIAGERDEVTPADLGLPDLARAVYYYRDGKFSFVEEKTKFRKGDEVIILTHSKNLPELRTRWAPKQANKEGE
jgi:trk system potassium uptake protein TrkA